MESNEPLITALELQEVTREARLKQSETPDGEKVDAWIKWFMKGGLRIIRDAALRGDWFCSLPVPHPPLITKKEGSDEEYVHWYTSDNRKLIPLLKTWLPGCVIDVRDVEDEIEARNEYTIEICWKPAKKKKRPANFEMTE